MTNRVGHALALALAASPVLLPTRTSSAQTSVAVLVDVPAPQRMFRAAVDAEATQLGLTGSVEEILAELIIEQLRDYVPLFEYRRSGASNQPAHLLRVAFQSPDGGQPWDKSRLMMLMQVETESGAKGLRRRVEVLGPENFGEPRERILSNRGRIAQELAKLSKNDDLADLFSVIPLPANARYETSPPGIVTDRAYADLGQHGFDPWEDRPFAVFSVRWESNGMLHRGRFLPCRRGYVSGPTVEGTPEQQPVDCTSTAASAVRGLDASAPGRWPAIHVEKLWTR